MTAPLFPERYLYRFWVSGYLFGKPLHTSTGQPVIILDPGQPATSSGPDFTGATLLISDQRLTGDVEMHVRSEDWFHHNHHNDPAFSGTIMHLVYENRPGYDSVPALPGIRVPQVVLTPKYTLRDILTVLTAADRLNFTRNFPCQPQLIGTEPVLSAWIQELGHRSFLTKLARYESRKRELLADYRYTAGKREIWDQLLYEGLFRALGYPHNQLAMEELAKNTPFCDWPSGSEDPPAQLLSDWLWMADLAPSVSELPRSPRPLLKKTSSTTWRTRSVRAANQPAGRLQAAAGLVTRYLQTGFLKPLLLTLDAALMMTSDKRRLFNQLDELLVPEDRFGGTIGKERRESVLFNTWFPVLYLWARDHQRPDIQRSILDLCDSHSHRQHIARDSGLRSVFDPAGTSFSTHWGLLRLDDEYCRPKRCLECRVGQQIISSAGYSS
ncbi:MAG: DUF2851 family protein [Bacteroidetes bacterium]|nr:DUF2851 family protein [Bacteroidota bacterium]